MFPHIFWKVAIPDNVPTEMEKDIKELKKSKNKEECLKSAYDILTKKYRGEKFGVVTRFPALFATDVHKLWNNSGVLPCTTLNYLLRVLLVNSGFFKDEEISHKWTLVWYFSPHQYLSVSIDNNQSVNVDPWGQANGVKFGSYAHGFL